ncbi:MAG: histidine phosphatase family protein [Gaiellaceae bacterium]
MKTLVLARHAQSRLSVLDRLNGDPSVEVGLTEVGREEARDLGKKAGAVDLVAHTAFGRTRETAELAWPGTPLLVVPELNEIGFGRFEGTHWDEGYRDWVLTSGADEPSPGGGESRLDAIRRYLVGYRLLLQRPEERVALVAHGAQVRYVLLGLDELPPMRLLERVPPATPFVIPVDRFARAVDVIGAWVAQPAF